MPKNNSIELIELYKIYVDTTSKTSETRMKINAFFVSINTIIIGSSSYVNPGLLLFFGICINCLWIELIKSYRDLNNAKFKVIHGMEQQLCCKCFKQEEEIYKTIKRQSITNIEKRLPYLIMGLYGIMLIYIKWATIESIFQKICYLLG